MFSVRYEQNFYPQFRRNISVKKSIRFENKSPAHLRSAAWFLVDI